MTMITAAVVTARMDMRSHITSGSLESRPGRRIAALGDGGSVAAACGEAPGPLQRRQGRGGQGRRRRRGAATVGGGRARRLGAATAVGGGRGRARAGAA